MNKFVRHVKPFEHAMRKWNIPMLSAKSEQFLLELRMCLIRHAKSSKLWKIRILVIYR